MYLTTSCLFQSQHEKQGGRGEDWTSSPDPPGGPRGAEHQHEGSRYLGSRIKRVMMPRKTARSKNWMEILKASSGLLFSSSPWDHHYRFPKHGVAPKTKAFAVVCQIYTLKSWYSRVFHFFETSQHNKNKTLPAYTQRNKRKKWPSVRGICF